MELETKLSIGLLFTVGVMLLSVFTDKTAFWISFGLLVALVCLSAIGIWFNGFEE